MKHLFYFLIGTSLLISCKGDNDTTGSIGSTNSEELARLKSENRALEDQLVEKDSVLNESFMLFNEIEENLAKINLKEDEIRFRTNDVELAEDGKQWIIQEIQNINYLREANQKKVKELNAKLNNKDIEISELNALVSNLMNKINFQEEEIEMLRVELAELDREYVELLEAYQEQTEIAVATIKELNRVYYAYGTQEELISNGVIIKEGGFIGIGKKEALKNDFNDDYFTEIDLTQKNEIEVIGKKLKFITDHPSSAYEIATDGEKNTIQIKDPKAFWKVSKYLVIVVD